MPLQTGIFASLIAEENQALATIAANRSSLESPQTPLSYPAEWLLDIFNGGRTDSGIRVSELTALQVAAIHTCVDLISGKISSLPCHVMERSLNDSGRAIHRVAYEHGYYDMLHNEPNEEMSWQTFLKTFMAHCLLWGNGYAEIQRDSANRAVALWPRNPGKTRPRRVTQRIVLDAVPWRPYPMELLPGTYCFETTDDIGEPDYAFTDAQSKPTRIIPNHCMLHVPGLSLDGRLGQQPVWLARETIGLALMLVKFGSKYFANFSRPGGMLELPGYKKEERDAARLSWQESQGGENSNRVAVMPLGTKWTQVSNNPEQSQSIQTKQYVRTEIAAIFHVPGRMVGDSQRQSKASTEQENQEFLDYTLSPWLNAFKQEAKRKIFPHPGVGSRPKSPFFIDFETWEMIRGDSASREKFYASGRQWAYLSTNDIRAFEKLNPINEPWAEEYWIPVNMTLVTTPINPNFQDGSGVGSDVKARFAQFTRFAKAAMPLGSDLKLAELLEAFAQKETDSAS